MNRLAALGLTACCIALSAARVSAETLAEAPAGYDNQTNGFLSQATFEAYRALFEQRMGITDGLGPVYEAPSCAQCHYNPLLASSSTATVLQVGHFDGTSFIAHPGGSQIHSSAIDPAIQERVLPGHEVRAFQVATNLLGAGFVEAIADQALRDTAARQPIKMRGTLINVPVLEAGGAPAVGKFGLKAYHASLLSATAQSFRDYLGITNVWLPEENTSNGNPVDEFDAVPDPEDMGGVDAVTAFLRSTKVPPRDPELVGTRDVIDGERIFDRIGCAVCHVPSITTAPPGTLNNAGTFTVPPVLGDKTIHPYSDFLLHDIGTGDGIVANGPPSTRNQIRTIPLWGVRVRPRLMHDGMSLELTDAIARHQGQAASVTARFQGLSPADQDRVLAFLRSL